MIKIVTTCYNCEEFIEECIRSVLLQEYDEWEMYIFDDASTDNSIQVAENTIDGDPRIKIIKNSRNMGAVYNKTFSFVKNCSPDDEDIIVMLDGDDWLASQNVFSKLNDIYNKEQCLMTYGSYVEYPSKLRGKFAKKIPDHIVKDNSYRQQEWMSSHLRTFKYKEKPAAKPAHPVP